MKLEDIEKSLPNGFHDAFLKNINIDYMKREVQLDLDIWIGDLASDNVETREAYRSGQLKVYDLMYCAIEAPSKEYPYQKTEKLRITAGPLKKSNEKKVMPLPLPVPKDIFVYWFFVAKWNSFIQIAAKDAKFTWK